MTLETNRLYDQDTSYARLELAREDENVKKATVQVTIVGKSKEQVTVNYHQLKEQLDSLDRDLGDGE